MACLTHLQDAELLRHAQVDFDPLTGTALEAELLVRFEKLLAEHEALAGPIDAIESLGFDLTKTKDLERLGAMSKLHTEFEGWDVAGLLRALAEFDIEAPEYLKKLPARDAAFRSLTEDLAEPLGRLQTLITTE